MCQLTGPSAVTGLLAAAYRLGTRSASSGCSPSNRFTLERFITVNLNVDAVAVAGIGHLQPSSSGIG